MFSFHKPKIYRSNSGCCICKAKSSSSRFTDSKKYENEFERCFRIEEKRSGEICNACVLLVKRWKKLSPENRLTKHWHHVVDARAGPGTKLAGNRRLGGPHSTSGSLSDSTSAQQKQRQQSTVLPLSSSQASNQSVGQSSALNSSSSSSSTGNTGRKRGGSFSKARAIDTNVSTFTFGEPVYRRSYMATESSFTSSSLSIYSSSPLAKPQSALNTSAFESVIKRFRQRQQQQQLEAQRRLLNRQQRLLQQQQQDTQNESDQTADKQNKQQQEQSSDLKSKQNDAKTVICSDEVAQVTQTRRFKRCSDSIDGIRVNGWLDSSLWRKEKICCGIIFRGLHNEVAVFPKLLKPCQCRENKLRQHQQNRLATLINQEEENLLSGSEEPPPRTAKSDSISSCDSNTSGTGSMEQPAEERVSADNESSSASARQQQKQQRIAIRRQPVKQTGKVAEFKQRNTAQTITRRQQQQVSSRKLCTNDMDSNTSSSSSSVLSSSARATNNVEESSRKGSLSSSINQQSEAVVSSPSSSSGASSTRLLQITCSEPDDDYQEVDDDEMADEEVDEEELMEDEDVESNTDASSSIDSLTEVERKKSTSHIVGAMG